MIAGVFRRKWDSGLLKAIVDNLIRFGNLENPANGNIEGLARMYHRLAPTVRAFYDEGETPAGELKLSPKKHREAVVA